MSELADLHPIRYEDLSAYGVTRLVDDEATTTLGRMLYRRVSDLMGSDPDTRTRIFYSAGGERVHVLRFGHNFTLLTPVGRDAATLTQRFTQQWFVLPTGALIAVTLRDAESPDGSSILRQVQELRVDALVVHRALKRRFMLATLPPSASVNSTTLDLRDLEVEAGWDTQRDAVLVLHTAWEPA